MSRKDVVRQRRERKRQKIKTSNLNEVTLFLCMITLAFLFAILGSLMLSHVFKWDIHESVWFMFVTMTTIGFGDFFPNWKECMLEPPSLIWKGAYITGIFALITAGLSCMITVLQR